MAFRSDSSVYLMCTCGLILTSVLHELSMVVLQYGPFAWLFMELECQATNVQESSFMQGDRMQGKVHV